MKRRFKRALLNLVMTGGILAGPFCVSCERVDPCPSNSECHEYGMRCRNNIAQWCDGTCWIIHEECDAMTCMCQEGNDSCECVP